MKNILQGIGIVFTLIASFLGLMYILKGDVIVSSLVSLVIIVIQYFLIEKFIKSKSEITKNKFSTLSILLWLFYIILSIPTSIFLMHALNVELNAKKEIQKTANSKIADLTNMANVFNAQVEKGHTTLSIDLTNKLTIYAQESNSRHRTLTDSVLKAKPYNLSDAEIAAVDNTNIQSTVNNFIGARLLKFKPVIDSVKNNNKNFVTRYSGVFDGWSRLHLNYAFYELDSLLKKNKETLNKVYTKNMEFSADQFSYTYNTDEVNMDKPALLFMKHKPYYLIVVVLLFFVLILLPYIIEPVSGTYIKQAKGSRDRGRGGIEI